jgi:hypothetical protein
MSASDLAMNFLPTFLEFVLGGVFIMAARRWKLPESYLMLSFGAMGFLGCVGIMAFAESSVSTMGIVLTLLGAVALAVWTHIMFSTWREASRGQSSSFENPQSTDAQSGAPKQSISAMAIIGMFILLVGLVLIRWYNSGPAYSFRGMDEVQKKVMRTLWEFQKQAQQLGPGYERRFPMRIDPGMAEYWEFQPHLDPLTKAGYINCLFSDGTRGQFCILDNPGITFMQSIGDLAKGPTYPLKFDYIDISAR